MLCGTVAPVGVEVGSHSTRNNVSLSLRTPLSIHQDTNANLGCQTSMRQQVGISTGYIQQQ